MSPLSRDLHPRLKPGREHGRMPTLLQNAIEDRIVAGASLAEVEREVIAHAPVDEERRAALWLFAWLRFEQAPGTRAVRVPNRIAS